MKRACNRHMPGRHVVFSWLPGFVVTKAPTHDDAQVLGGCELLFLWLRLWSPASVAPGSWGQVVPHHPGGGSPGAFLGRQLRAGVQAWGVGTWASTVVPYAKPAFAGFLLLR